MKPTKWRAASNGAGKMHWFLYRDAPEIRQRYYWNENGNLRRFASYEAAQRAANIANR